MFAHSLKQIKLPSYVWPLKTQLVNTDTWDFYLPSVPKNNRLTFPKMEGRLLIQSFCWAVLRCAMCFSHARTIKQKYIVPMINTTSMIKLQLVLDRYINQHEIDFKICLLNLKHCVSTLITILCTFLCYQEKQAFCLFSFFHPFFLYIIIFHYQTIKRYCCGRESAR